MPIINRILDLVRYDKNGMSRKIIIPYGKHSYGPQPATIGILPWILPKARGSKVGNSVPSPVA